MLFLCTLTTMVRTMKVICLLFSSVISVSAGYEWKYVGCYKNENAKPVLDGNSSTADDMTPSVCETTCIPHRFFGLTKSNECVCGENLNEDVTESSECSSPCKGDFLSICGGLNDIAIYRKPEYYLGCYSINEIDDWIKLQDDNYLTPELCRERCGQSTYTYAAIHFKTCFCCNTIPKHSSLKNEHDCSGSCPGGSQQGCGGAETVSVYEGKGYIGCFGVTDVTNRSESLGAQSTVVEIKNNFVQHCMATCKNGGYFYTAVSGNYCHCGIVLSASERLPYENCNTECPGDNGRYCGGDKAVSIYQTPKFHFGCMHFPSTANDVWEKIDLPDMTLSKCRTECGSRLFELSGIKVNNNQDDCYCTNKIHSNAEILESTHCKSCPDVSHLTCGGNDSISVYASTDLYCHCKVYGDPHYQTFDGLHFNYQGHDGPYLLIETIGHVRCHFDLIAQNKLLHNGKLAVTDHATLNINGNIYVFSGNGKIQVNGFHITQNVDHPKFIATLFGQYSQVEIKNCGVIVRSDKTAHLDIYLDREDYGQRVKGPCGDCNGDRLNDLRLNNGTNIAYSDQHGELVGKSFELNGSK